MSSKSMSTLDTGAWKSNIRDIFEELKQIYPFDIIILHQKKKPHLQKSKAMLKNIRIHISNVV